MWIVSIVEFFSAINEEITALTGEIGDNGLIEVDFRGIFGRMVDFG